MTLLTVRDTGRRPTRGVAVAGVLACAGYVAVLMWALAHATYDVWVGMLLVPLLMAVSAPVLLRAARRDDDPTLGQLLLLALLLKLLSAVARYYMAFVLYEGVADSQAYHDHGVHLAALLRLGLYEQPPGPFPGTATLSIITGVVYAVFGPAMMTGFFVFSWMGFWGLFLFFRAFRLALPQADSRRYAALVLFLPSLLFWPSSIGKESWMTFMLGLATYGAARFLTRHPGGLPCLAAGLTGVALVRPHMAILVFSGLFVAYLLRPSARTSLLSPLAKAAMVVLLLGSGAVLLQQTQSFFGLEETSASSVGDVIDATNAQTSQGGSAYDAAPVRSPADLPMAAVNVLFRPFPHEASNPQALVAAAEGVALLALAVASSRRLRTLPGLLRHNSYLVFVSTYTLLFITAFSSFANFGILTRQRVQVFPFFLVLLALPKAQPRERRALLVPALPPRKDLP